MPPELMNVTLTPLVVVMVYRVTGLPPAVVPNGELVSDAPFAGAANINDKHIAPNVRANHQLRQPVSP